MNELTKNQKLAIEVLANSDLSNKFYWSGGTLLAVKYLNHRKSEDVDFFSNERFGREELEDWLNDFMKRSGLKKFKEEKIYDRWEFGFEGGEGLRVEFVYYNHDRKTLVKRVKYKGVMVDSLDDIAANKTLAFIDRNEPKDLFDIYFLIKKTKFTPKKLLDLVERKFGCEFEEGLFWSESYRKAPLLDKMVHLILNKNKSELIDEIKEYFGEGARQFLKRKLG